jgi:hypothetical protein
MLKKCLCPATALLLFILSAPAVRAASADDLIAKLKAVGKEGADNVEAAKAWKELVKLGPDALLPILASMDDNKRTASNWLRPAVDAIGEKALNDKKPLPKDDLEKFVRKTDNPPAGRRIAYEWLARIDTTAPARLLPGMIQDPSTELRHEAVAVVIDEAKKVAKTDDKKAAIALFQKALTGACVEEQVDDIVKQLKLLGVEVDVAAHLGFIRGWHFVTPFDNTDEAGYKTVYPPEKGVDLKAQYTGKGGAEAKWIETTTDDAHGVVDLYQVLAEKPNPLVGNVGGSLAAHGLVTAGGKKLKAVVGYAFAAIDSPAERPVQIRLGSIGAVKVFLNGKEVYAHDEYHHGSGVDQYIANGTLKAGKNELLLKVCQNDQKESWAQVWVFQARLCDAVGAAVPFTLASPKPMEDK